MVKVFFCCAEDLVLYPPGRGRGLIRPDKSAFRGGTGSLSDGTGCEGLSKASRSIIPSSLLLAGSGHSTTRLVLVEFPKAFRTLKVSSSFFF